MIHVMGMLFASLSIIPAPREQVRRDGTPSCTMKGTRCAGAFHYPGMLFNLIKVM